MKRSLAALLISLACWCTGCASGLIGTLPVVADRENAAEIFVIRPYNYVASGTSAYVSFDNSDVLALRTVQYASFLAPPGNHTIGVRYPWFPSNDVAVSLAPKARYFFGVSVGFYNFSLVQKSEEEARPHIESSNRVPLEKDLKK